MAATTAVNRKAKAIGELVSTGTFTGDNSYPTGGYAVTGNTFGFNVIDTVILAPQATSAVAIMAFFNPTTSKIQLLVTATNVEVANAVDVSAIVWQFVAFGH